MSTPFTCNRCGSLLVLSILASGVAVIIFIVGSTISTIRTNSGGQQTEARLSDKLKLLLLHLQLASLVLGTDSVIS